MNDLDVKKMALGFALITFTLLTFGSWVGGARILTSFIRGIEGFFLFGGLAWILGTVILNRMTGVMETPDSDETMKGSQLDERV